MHEDVPTQSGVIGVQVGFFENELSKSVIKSHTAEKHFFLKIRLSCSDETKAQH